MSTLPTYYLLFIALAFSDGVQGKPIQSGQQWIARGDSLLAMGKALRSVDYYDRAIAAGARADGYSARAKAWYELDRMDRFILDVETALDMNRSHAFAHFQRALYAMRSRDWSLAKTSCDRSLGGGIDQKTKPEVLICRGEALVQLGKPEAAINDLNDGINLGSKDVEALRLLAMLYHDVDMHEAAVTVLKKLLLQDSSDATDRVNLGFELATLGRHREAIEQYDIALSSIKNHPVALSNYAYSLYKLGKNQEAYDYVKRSLRSEPNNPFALRTRALLRLSTGDKEKACKDLYEAKLGGDFPDVEALIDKHCVGIKR
jgi:tetratricopeptide (TPR) repeat protein